MTSSSELRGRGIMWMSFKSLCLLSHGFPAQKHTSPVFLLLSVHGDSSVARRKVRGREIHAAAASSDEAACDFKSVSSAGRHAGAGAPSLSDSQMETCRWDLKNSITFKPSAKSRDSHLDRTCCLPVTALVVSSLFMWLKQEAKQWQSHCCVSLLKSDLIRTYLCWTSGWRTQNGGQLSWNAQN